MFGLTSAADEVSDLSLEQKVLNIIRNNPEIVLEAIKLLQDNEVSVEINDKGETQKSSNQIFKDDPQAPILGNPDGSVTIIEFFDYNCGYCKIALTDMIRLMDYDPNLRIILKEYPILNQSSDDLARLSLASAKQG
mgnify:CR=1 FL=1